MANKEIINVIALLLAPVISVIIAQYLQERAKKREDKMNVFKTLLASRVYGWTPDSVNALNTVEVVFSDKPSVVKQWRAYYDKLCIQNPSDMDVKKRDTERDKFLLEMANALGYKDKVTWETIQNPYIPTGMADSIKKQNDYMSYQMAIMKNLALSMQLGPQNQIVPQQTQPSSQIPEADNAGH